MEYYWNGNDDVFLFRDHHIKGLRTFSYSKNHRNSDNLSRHYHKGCMEFMIVLNGAYTLVVEDETYTAEKGDVFVVCRDQIHGLAKSAGQSGEMIGLLIDLSEPDGFLGLSTAQAENLMRKMDDIDLHVVKSEAAAGQAASAFKHVKQLDSENLAIAQSSIVIFLYKILLVTDRPGKISRNIRESVKYINKHIMEDLDLETLSRACGLSTSYFKHKFKNEMNITPKDYVNQKKIDIARELLLENAVGEVAKMLSFTTSNYFAVVFKKLTGLTPSEYRALNMPMMQVDCEGENK